MSSSISESVSNGWNLDRRTLLEDRVRADTRRAVAVFEADLTWSGGATVAAAIGPQTLGFDLAEWAGGTRTAADPVEAVLAALAADVIQHLTRIATDRGAAIAVCRAHVEGGVDLGRTLGIVAGRPGIDLVQLDVEIDAAADSATIEGWLAEAVRRSPIAGLFAAAGEPVQARLVPADQTE